MQSISACGRVVTRLLFTGRACEVKALHSTGECAEATQPGQLCLITAASGFSKTQSAAQILKKWSFGDDACFIAGHRLADVIGVADGVGGWRSYGVDPSKFPKSLMETCERLVKDGRFTANAPVGIIAAAYSELLESKTELLGSCTACVVSLHKDDHKLYTANLGDSGFMLVREGKILHRSVEQQHYFNTPFQLAVAPSTLQGHVLSDSPESAESSSFGVEEGDIILVGSDGLFDNLSEDMILHHLRKLKVRNDNKRESVERIAYEMAKQAHDLSFDPNYMSPFAKNAVENGFNVKGGKPDDITVLLSRVTGTEMFL